LDLDENTIVIFLGDQGLAGGHSGFWGMGDHTRPLTAYDWTTWIPFIVRHKGRIAGGRRSDFLVSNYDVLPTLMEYIGLGDKSPKAPPRPGRSFSKMLDGRDVEWDNTVFFEFENVRSIRTAEWKYIERIYQTPNELYHLADDAGERLDLYNDPRSADVRRDLQQRLKSYFDRYADPKWDLWKGGKSKIDLITSEFFGLENPYRPGRYEPGPGEGKGR
jgi:arylsulfatase A-like enzyme